MASQLDKRTLHLAGAAATAAFAAFLGFRWKPTDAIDLNLTYYYQNAKVGGRQISGSGVTFYLINGASVSMNGNADINFTAPTDGSTYSGFLFLNGRTNTGSITINGDATSAATGIIYSPNGAVNYNGNFSGAGGCTQIIAKTVSWSGSTTFKDGCGGIFPPAKMGGVVRLSA